MVDFAEFKKFFMYTLICSLIICAGVAVVSVLIGGFTDTLGKVLFTLLMIVVHSLIAMVFIWDDEKQGTFSNFRFFIDTIFFIIISSFLTSIFGVWEIFGIDLVLDFYKFYLILVFASLHANILYKALGKETYLDVTIFLNYAFMGFVVFLIGVITFFNNPVASLPDLLFRGLGALAIIDGTLSILVVIFYRLHLSKYPKQENPLQNSWGYPDQTPPAEQKKGLSIWVWILIIYLVLQIFFGFFINFLHYIF